MGKIIDLHVSMLKRYGVEYINFDPSVIASDNPELTEDDLDKIQAVCTLLSTDSFYRDHQVFTAIVRVFNDLTPSFGALIPLSPQEIMTGLIMARLLDDDKEEYTDDIKEYIKQCLKYHGSQFTLDDFATYF